MIRFWRQPRNEAETPRPERVCLDGQPATVLSRTDEWVTVQLSDGSTPNVLPSRVTDCTCGGGDCA
ncbi:hypothetical protein ACFWYW_56750 [Nonomuraea sp. NPDC059023]|uniref:hypothetical protein n=1 Tax=unclassified Nonomuraea TaxID=2593643 RepID=UPI0036BF1A77